MNDQQIIEKMLSLIASIEENSRLYYDEDDKWRRENILSVKRTDKYLSGDGRYVRKPEDNVSGKL